MLPRLQALFDDDQLRAMEGEIIASMDPADLAWTLGLMLEALTPAERAHLMASVRVGAPPSVLEALLREAAKSVLMAAEFAGLSHRLAA